MTKSNPRGRPTAYKPEYCQELLDYFSIRPYETLEVKDNTGQVKEAKPIPNLFPTLARFACKCGVTRDTLYEWSTATNEDGSLKHPEFSYAYKRAKEFQEAILVIVSLAFLFCICRSIFSYSRHMQVFLGFLPLVYHTIDTVSSS